MVDARELIEAVDEYLAIASEFLGKLSELYRRRREALRVLMNPEELARVVEGMSDEEAGRLFKTLMALSEIATGLSSLGSLEPDELEELRRRLEEARRQLRRAPA